MAESWDVLGNIIYVIPKKGGLDYYFVVLPIIMLLCPANGMISFTPITTVLVSGSFIGLFVGFCNARSVVTAPPWGIS
jgi:hypothetical protein